MPEEVLHMKKPKKTTEATYHDPLDIIIPAKTYANGMQGIFSFINEKLGENWIDSDSLSIDYDDRKRELKIKGGVNNRISFDRGLKAGDTSPTSSLWVTEVGFPKPASHLLQFQEREETYLIRLNPPKREKIKLYNPLTIILYDKRNEHVYSPFTYPAGREFQNLKDFFKQLDDWIQTKTQYKDYIYLAYSDTTNRLLVSAAAGFHATFSPEGNGTEEWNRTIGIPLYFVGRNITDAAQIIDLEDHRTPIPYTLSEELRIRFQKFKGNKTVWIDESIEEEEEENMVADEPQTIPKYSNVKIRIKEGHYSTTQDLVDEINNEIEKFDTKIDDNIKIILEKSGHVKVNIQNIDTKDRFKVPADNEKEGLDLGSMLGFEKQQLKRWIEYPGAHGNVLPDIRRGVHGIYVYTNLVLPQFVGDTLAPLIRVINPLSAYRGGSETLYKGETISYHYKTIYYYPLARNTFDTIEINLLSDYGEPLKFTGGKTLLQLHFRRK